jgi:hypothetical protein
VIPVTLNAETVERYIRNVTEAYDRTNNGQRDHGAAWYRVANQHAYAVGDGDVKVGAAVIAALSANKSWSENLRLATQCRDGQLGGHVRDTLDKVERLYEGEEPETVLPMGSKTGHFYRCILDPYDPRPVVIDRHAHDVAVGEIYGNRDRGLSSAARYDNLRLVYTSAARRLGMIPQVLQATVWVAHIERKGR